MQWNNYWNGTVYTDPKDELKGRMDRCLESGDEYVNIPLPLAIALLVEPKYCEARTVVNGDQWSKTLIEVKCTREIDPGTGKHPGWHINGKTTWE